MKSPQYVVLSDRFYALVIDGFIFVIPVIILEYFILTSDTSINTILLSQFIYFVGVHFYTIYLHTVYGQTLGKMAVNLKVLKTSKENITLIHAILREFPFVFFSLFTLASEVQQTLSIGITSTYGETFLDYLILISALIWMIVELVVALLNEKRRSIHDFIGGTVVIKISNAENLDRK